jgi:diaminohydroxyphosphoribosylaminopyrimidine deaminase/5-amino-6-(5-phosphoribosylamino)uracil reductase
MRRALALARRAEGRTFPNPAVGAVVLRGDRVLATGFTRPPGGPHAEVVALAAALRRHGARSLRGACLAVTLEPCSHTGRTPPCTDAIIAAGIGRVWVGTEDPFPMVGGRGLEELRRAGIRVETGILAGECRRHHRGFLSVHERGRPFVTLKLAATLDGRIATARGESRWITGEAARRFVHRLRARTDAVMVGSGTVLADDPALTARRAGRVVHRPVAIVVDSRLRVPPRARLFREARAGRALVLTARGADPRRRRALEAAGARIVAVRRRAAGLDLAAALHALGREGITTLLVEGGAGLAAALLRAGLVDELHWLVAQRLLGGDGRPALASLGVVRLGDALVLERPRLSRLGADLHVEARVDGRARGRGAVVPPAGAGGSR